MNKFYLLLLTVCVASASCFGQDEKSEVGFYNGSRLSVGLFKHWKFYPELQVESKSLKFDDAQYSFRFRNSVDCKTVDFVWGIGYTYNDRWNNESNIVVPLELRKNNLLDKNISLSIGAEVVSDLVDEWRIKPLLGVFINF